jgi:hypothetical protein
MTTEPTKRKRKVRIVLKIFDRAGSFAENKDVARDIREELILKALAQGNDIVLDYAKVDTTTQSFTHALISQAIREYGVGALDRILFKNCNEDVRRIVSIVVEYMQGNVDTTDA